MRIVVDGAPRDIPAMWWDPASAGGRGGLRMLDQRLLPGRVEVLTLTTPEQVAEAIQDMAVRGAPAIGCAAAWGVALGAREAGRDPAATVKLLAGTRPTARDLFHALEHMEAALQGKQDPVAAARDYQDDVVERCRRIGLHGAALLREGMRVMTHCNAGALATVDWGTALAPMRAAHRAGLGIRVLASETRPRLQGLLTAWELMQEGIPVEVVPDGASGHLLARGEVDLVITGADRVARNGDAANKIGTYEKAVLAREHGVPFYIAAPRTTFDPACATGAGIPIEERGAEEVLSLAGQRVAPQGLGARNPAFDVTPARLITGFVTEDGVLKPDEVAGWVER